jgi:hypothetical protein
MNVIIVQGTKSDIEEIVLLYDNICEYLQNNVNYAGWRKGVYPIRDTGAEGITMGTLYVANVSEKIVGSIILNHNYQPPYDKVK